MKCFFRTETLIGKSSISLSWNQLEMREIIGYVNAFSFDFQKYLSAYDGSGTYCFLDCESENSEVIMRTWVKNSVRITDHGPRFPIIGFSRLGYTTPKNWINRPLNSIDWWSNNGLMGVNNKRLRRHKKLFWKSTNGFSEIDHRSISLYTVVLKLTQVGFKWWLNLF